MNHSTEADVNMHFPATDAQPANTLTHRQNEDALVAELQQTRSYARQIRHQWLETVDAIRDPIMVHDAEGRIVRSNRAYAELAGIGVKEIIGRKYWECFPRRGGPMSGCQHCECCTSGARRTEEFAVSGGEIFVSNAYKLGDDAAPTASALHIFRNVTAERALQTELQARARRAIAQSEALSALSSTGALLAGDLPVLARELTELAAKACGVARANVWVFNEDESELSCVDHFDAATREHSRGMVLTQAQFANEFRALKSSAYVAADDPLTDPRTAGYIEGYLKPNRITSMLDAVVEVSGRHLGLLCLEHVDRAHHWEPDEIAFVRQAAEKIALAISNRQARQAEQATREQARFPAENPNAVMRLSAAGLVLYANPASIDLQRLIGAGMGEYARGEYATLVREGMASGETRELERNSPDRFYALTLVPFPKEGYANIYATDITLRKRAERTLAESQQRLALATRSARIGIWDWDVVANKLVWDERMYQLYGIREQDFGGAYEAWQSGLHPEDREQAEAATAAALRGEREFNPEFRVIWPNGEIRHIEAHATVQRAEDGSATRMIGVNWDITDRKRNEAALSESRDLLGAVIENAPMRVFWKDSALRLLGCNSAFARDAGPSSPQELIGKDDYQMAWREQAEQYRADDRAVIETNTAKLGIEEPQTTPDGHTIWLRTSKVPLRGADGRTMGVLGMYEDVTQRRADAEKLRESEQRFRGYFELGLIGMAVTLPDKGIAEANDKLCEILGYSRAELQKMDWASITHPGDLGTDVAQFNRMLAGEIERYSLDKRFIRKDGAAVYTTLSVSCVRRPDRSVEYVMALIQDISERKRAEESLRGALIATVEAIAATVETRDPYTAGHQSRVADLATAIALEMGLPQEHAEGIHFGAQLHDLGKMQIPVELLAKPTRLTKLELELIKTHPQAGYEIVKDIKFPWRVAEIVHQHHERLDGSGYPQGLKGDAIALEARIVAVADVVEAMSSHRPYRPGLGVDAALKEIESKRGTWFDPQAVDACLRLFREKNFQLQQAAR